MACHTKDLDDEKLFAEFVSAFNSGGDINKFTSHDQLDRLMEQTRKHMARHRIADEQQNDTLSDVSYISYNNKVTTKSNKLQIVLTYFFGKNKYYFAVDPNVFSSGHFKIAYRATMYMSEVSTSFAPRIANNTSVVLKIKKDPGFHTTTPRPIWKRNQWNDDLKELNTLRVFTEEWNEQGYSDKKYSVSQASVLKVSDIGKDGTGMFKKNEYVLVEPYMPSFEKWNWPSSAEKDAKALSIQAFGHYTYHSSAGKVLINDAQGFRDSDKYILTDPYYLYSDKNASTIVNWFQDHHCNKFCKQWWRRPKGTVKKELSSTQYYGLFGSSNSSVRATQFI